MSTKKLMRQTNNQSEGTTCLQKTGRVLLAAACLSFLAAQAAVAQNNNFSAANVVTTSPVTGSNVGATREAGEPTTVQYGSVREPAGERSVWWRWTAPASGSTLVATGDPTLGGGPRSNFDTQLGVYTGNAVNALTEVASNEDAEPNNRLGGGLSEVTFNATAGTVYHIMVNGHQNAEGNIVLFVQQGGGGGGTTNTISASVSPAGAGSVTGAGNYQSGQTANLVATGNPGFTFVNWTEGGTQVSANANYSFTVSGNRALVANFSGTADTNNVIVTVTRTPATGGTVSGAGTAVIGSTVTLVATPASGFTFVNWTENGAAVSTSPTLTFTAATNRTLVANFSGSSTGVTEFRETLNFRLTARSQRDIIERATSTQYRARTTRISNRDLLDLIGGFTAQTFPRRATLVLTENNQVQVRDRDTVLADVTQFFVQDDGEVSVFAGSTSANGRISLTEYFILFLRFANAAQNPSTWLDLSGLATSKWSQGAFNSQNVASARSSVSAKVHGEGELPSLGGVIVSGKVTSSGRGRVARD
jgi:hypothetical protein